MTKPQYPLKIVDVDLKNRKITRMYSCDEQGNETDLTHGVCHNCGAVVEGLYSKCPNCYSPYQDRTDNLRAYFETLTKNAGMGVLYDKLDGSEWVFSPDGEFQPSGPLLDDIMYYEEREHAH